MRNENCIGFIGLGLIGGSIAKAIKKSHPDYRLISFYYSKQDYKENHEQALLDGILDEAFDTLSASFHQCNYIFLCAPVIHNCSYLPQLKSLIHPACIVTDVGSVKGIIHHAAMEHGLSHNFIGGHPMAGSEKSGYAHSNSLLLENAYYILTPCNDVPMDAVDNLSQLIKDMKAIPIPMNATYHDDVVAAISHVPHVIASSLVHLLQSTDDENRTMLLLAAGGFKDITRIASASPAMWESICLTNAESILSFLQQFKFILTEAEQIIREKDRQAIYRFFETAKDVRNQIPAHGVGLIKQVYEVFVDISDETGAIATIATLLAHSNISIKNIGIIHNREFEDGVLRIELYNEEAVTKTVALLTQSHYTIYKR